MLFPHRSHGYQMLSGTGVEIGAFHQPAPLPHACDVHYCDAVTREEAAQLFPELHIDQFVKLDYLSDLDASGLEIFADGQWDFVVLNHVIEHVANPIQVISELFRVVKPGGFVVLSAPDRDYTFDKNRNLTPFNHLLDEYYCGVKEVTDEHYMDFLKGVHPEVFDGSNEEVEAALNNVKARREHAHVWDSNSFEEFMNRSLSALNLSAECYFKSLAFDNKFEYFSVWRKDKTLLERYCA